MKAFDNLAYEAKHEKKPQGIQWNKYPENKPTEDGYYLVVDFSGRLVQWTWLGVSTGMEWQDITHWAEINLPNQ